MEKLILALIPGNIFYWPEEYSNLEIIHLAHWLTDDVGYMGIEVWKEWINNPTVKWTGSNYSSLNKEDNKIILSFIYDDFEENPQAQVFVTSAAELNYILDRWQEACEKKPKKIIITRDHGKISVDFED